MEKLKVANDIGGSQGRQILDNRYQEFDSKYAIIPTDAYTIEQIEDKLSDFILTRKENTIRVIKGESLDYQNITPQVCDNTTHKANFEGTYINILYGIARDAVNRNVDNVSAKISMCLPPAEALSEANKLFKDSISGEAIVDFHAVGKKVEINIELEDVSVVPEGVIAVVTMDDKERKILIMKNYCVVVDIGYRSTDITILKGGKPVNGGYRSLPIGGINLEALLKGELERQGIHKSEDEIREIFKDGYMILNSKKVDLGAVVKAVKANFVEDLYSGVRSTANFAKVPLQSINYLIPVGRPFLPTGKEGTDTDGGLLTEMLESRLDIESIFIISKDLEIKDLDDKDDFATANVKGARMALGL